MKKNFFLGIMVLLGVWCLFYVGIKIDMWQLGYEIEDLERKRTVLQRQGETLQVRLSELADPQRIAHRAEEQLGLMIPQEGQIVMVSLDPVSPPESSFNSPAKLVREFSRNLLSAQ